MAKKQEVRDIGLRAREEIQRLAEEEDMSPYGWMADRWIESKNYSSWMRSAPSAPVLGQLLIGGADIEYILTGVRSCEQ